MGGGEEAVNPLTLINRELIESNNYAILILDKVRYQHNHVTSLHVNEITAIATIVGFYWNRE